MPLSNNIHFHEWTLPSHWPRNSCPAALVCTLKLKLTFNLFPLSTVTCIGATKSVQWMDLLALILGSLCCLGNSQHMSQGRNSFRPQPWAHVCVSMYFHFHLHNLPLTLLTTMLQHSSETFTSAWAASTNSVVFWATRLSQLSPTHLYTLYNYNIKWWLLDHVNCFNSWYQKRIDVSFYIHETKALDIF